MTSEQIEIESLKDQLNSWQVAAAVGIIVPSGNQDGKVSLAGPKPEDMDTVVYEKIRKVLGEITLPAKGEDNRGLSYEEFVELPGAARLGATMDILETVALSGFKDRHGSEALQRLRNEAVNRNLSPLDVLVDFYKKATEGK